jgi:hypothetical protein
MWHVHCRLSFSTRSRRSLAALGLACTALAGCDPRSQGPQTLPSPEIAVGSQVVARWTSGGVGDLDVSPLPNVDPQGEYAMIAACVGGGQMAATVAGPNGYRIWARVPCTGESSGQVGFGLDHDGPYVASREFSGNVSDWYVVIIKTERLPRS